MLDFAREEIVLPTGPAKGQLWNPHAVRHSGIVVEEMSSGDWRRVVVTGPSQSSKTFSIVIAACYHLFEMQETIIVGLPDMNMAADKWSGDFLPVIRASGFADLLPEHGRGSRGGNPGSTIRFAHGPVMRFMSGGGGDPMGFPARVVLITEVDRFTRSGDAGSVAAQIRMLEKRSAAWGDRARIYYDSIPTAPQGEIWQRWRNGSQSVPLSECIHCGAPVAPTREHLVGWREASSPEEAAEVASWACPANGCEISEADRKKMLADQVLDHRGDLRSTLSVRWEAWHNSLITTGYIAEEEYRAAHDENLEEADRVLVNETWGLPYSIEGEREGDFDIEALSRRVSGSARGEVPSEIDFLVAAIDVGKWRLHWMVMGAGDWYPIIDYGTWEVASREQEPADAISAALIEVREDVLGVGWGGDRPALTLVDSQYETGAVQSVCDDTADWVPTLGYGVGQRNRTYRPPTDDKRRRRRQGVMRVGPGWHETRRPNTSGQTRVELDANFWKSRVHAGLQIDVGDDGSIAAYEAGSDADHRTLARHWLSEREEVRLVESVGEQRIWRAISRHNHFLDVTSLCRAAIDIHRAGAGGRAKAVTGGSAPADLGSLMGVKK